MVLSSSGNYHGPTVVTVYPSIDDDNVIILNYIMFMTAYYKNEQNMS